jgi:hypothetical protein
MMANKANDKIIIKVPDEVEKQLNRTDPLHDRAFKVILSKLVLAQGIVHHVSGHKFGEEKEVTAVINEIVLKQHGKTVILDTLFTDEQVMANIEAESGTNKFPFKRHLSYWACIYADMLRRGEYDYNKQKPTYVIVIYRDYHSKEVIQEAHLAGSLRNDDSEQLRLFA